MNELPEDGQVTSDLTVPSRALAVGAHPDDIEFGCGATLAKWASRGCTIFHLVLTDGSKGSWEDAQESAGLALARREEQYEAARRLGGGAVDFLGLPDGELRNGLEEQREVCQRIRLVRPDVVLTHDPWRRYRLHPDHRHAGFIVTDALVAARDHMYFSDQGLASHRTSALLLWEADVPNHLETVEGFAEVKVHALLAHRSQHATSLGVAAGRDVAGSADSTDVDRLRARIEEQLARHGALVGASQGETFHLMTEL